MIVVVNLVYHDFLEIVVYVTMLFINLIPSILKLIYKGTGI